MRGWNSNKWGFWNKIFAGLCVVLALALAVFLFWYMRSERENVQEIVRQTMATETAQEADGGSQPAAEDSGESSAESSGESSAEDTAGETAGDGAAGQPSGEEAAGTAAADPAQDAASQDMSQAETDPADSGETAASTDITGISWRGDEFLSGSDIEEKGVAALLEQRLADAGYHIQVENFSLTGAGTLSQLRLAGVSERNIQWYVEDHKEKESSAQTETGVREFSDEELARSDQGYFPIIFMGYYGGWNSDPQELADQIQLILDTYDNPEDYLVLGLHPVSGGKNPEGYAQVMEDTWEDHYLDLPEVLGDATAASYEGQELIADAVFAKLTELGYLKGDQE